MVLIKGNKRTFRRPLDKVSITTYDTLQTTMVGERQTDTYMYIYTHREVDRHKKNKNIQKTTIQTRKKNPQLNIICKI